jgi:hypothetical protein
MANQNVRPPDDPSSAPESGTVRDDTSGNQPAAPRTDETRREGTQQKDDPSEAGEEK